MPTDEQLDNIFERYCATKPKVPQPGALEYIADHITEGLLFGTGFFIVLGGAVWAIYEAWPVINQLVQ